MITVTLPGRDLRAHEPRLTDLDSSVAWLQEELEYFVDEPHILLGHGMGAVLAYAYAQATAAAGGYLPGAVIVAGCRPPHLREPAGMFEAAAGDSVVSDMIMGGTLPTKVLTDPRWMTHLMPLVRDDLSIQYSFGRREVTPIPCPLHIFAGSHDDVTPPDVMAHWAGYSVAPQDVRRFDGGHFMFREPSAELAEAVYGVAQGKVAVPQGW